MRSRAGGGSLREELGLLPPRRQVDYMPRHPERKRIDVGDALEFEDVGTLLSMLPNIQSKSDNLIFFWISMFRSRLPSLLRHIHRRRALTFVVASCPVSAPLPALNSSHHTQLIPTTSHAAQSISFRSFKFTYYSNHKGSAFGCRPPLSYFFLGFHLQKRVVSDENSMSSRLKV